MNTARRRPLPAGTPWYARLVLAAPLTLTACGLLPAAALGVAVDTVDTDVLFGARTVTAPPAQAATPAPPATPTGVATPLPAPLPSDLPPQPDLTPATPAPIAFPVTAPVQACPQAPVSASPDQAASTDVTTMPPTGAQRWVGSGTGSVAVASATLTLPVPPSGVRYVRRVATATAAVPSLPGQQNLAYTYETVEPLSGPLQSGYADFHWSVQTNSPAKASANGTNVSDPQGGLVLTSVDQLDRSGKVVGSLFTSTGAGLLMLPLPITAGGSWTAAAVDRATNTTWQLSGQVLAREDIDACGSLIEGWHVSATLTTGGTATTTLDYDVATQFGALIESEKVSGPWFGATLNSTEHAGQEHLDPLPATFQ